MSPQTSREQIDVSPASKLGGTVIVFGALSVLFEVAFVAVALAYASVPTEVTAVVTLFAAVLLGGPFGLTVWRWWRGRLSEEKSRLIRVSEAIVSVTVLAGLAPVLGYGGATMLALRAKVDEGADSEAFRQRLWQWPDRNRAFMARGEGTIPIVP
ncbi:hypothetical protein [Halovenus marina]|uniref:hypothetical protein n=1 Tax=Halovenus marina TaxID=3396621 RepID=UPI003F5491A5